MNFSRSVTEIIEERSSCRTYKPEHISPVLQEKMREICSSPAKTPWGNSVRFEITTASAEDSESLKGLGTYGVIKNPAGFIIGAAKKGEGSLEDYGYAMESVILRATDLGLGTCWLGGTFSKSGFARKISRRGDETIPAVAALGYPLGKPSIRDAFSRGNAGLDRRMPWQELFFNGDFSLPLNPGESGEYDTALEMVRRAPSASNKQPWRIVRENRGNIFHFFKKRSPGYARTMKFLLLPDLQRVDMGIAMCHFHLSAVEKGLSGEWTMVQPKITLPEETYSYVATWRGN